MSRFLLDSHVLLGWAEDPAQLSPDSRYAIAEGRHLVYVSAATLWELGIKQVAGKLKLPEDLRSLLKSNRFDLLPISGDHALAAPHLPPHHRDPFDRLLIAQANIERFTLITRDTEIAKYDVPILVA